MKKNSRSSVDKVMSRLTDDYDKNIDIIKKYLDVDNWLNNEGVSIIDMIIDTKYYEENVVLALNTLNAIYLHNNPLPTEYYEENVVLALNTLNAIYLHNNLLSTEYKNNDNKNYIQKAIEEGFGNDVINVLLAGKYLPGANISSIKIEGKYSNLLECALESGNDSIDILEFLDRLIEKNIKVSEKDVLDTLNNSKNVTTELSYNIKSKYYQNNFNDFMTLYVNDGDLEFTDKFIKEYYDSIFLTLFLKYRKPDVLLDFIKKILNEYADKINFNYFFDFYDNSRPDSFVFDEMYKDKMYYDDDLKLEIVEEFLKYNKELDYMKTNFFRALMKYNTICLLPYYKLLYKNVEDVFPLIKRDGNSLVRNLKDREKDINREIVHYNKDYQYLIDNKLVLYEIEKAKMLYEIHSYCRYNKLNISITDEEFNVVYKVFNDIRKYISGAYEAEINCYYIFVHALEGYFTDSIVINDKVVTKDVIINALINYTNNLNNELLNSIKKHTTSDKVYSKKKEGC